VFSKAQRISDKFFTVLARKTGQQQSRLGLAIAKKKVRKATKRNQIKRLVRESFRLSNQSFIAYDVVVLCNSKANDATKQELSFSINSHWQKLAKYE